MPVNPNCVIVRGGQVKKGSLSNLSGGGDITTGGIVTSLSVQMSTAAGSVTDLALIRQLVAALPQTVFTVVYAKQLQAVKKLVLKTDPVTGNPLHGLISGGPLVDDVEAVFVKQSTVYTRAMLGI